jgi:prepilin-type N-terminal cleavage/methylation domain-containing protein
MHHTANKRGFSLAEIMVALVILSVIVMGLASTTITFLHETTLDNVRVRAATVADTRIAEVKGWPDYNGLVGKFNGTTNNYPDPGWTRKTVAVRDTSVTVGCNDPPFPPCPNNDVTRVTVTVTAPTLVSPVSRTIAVAAF